MSQPIKKGKEKGREADRAKNDAKLQTMRIWFGIWPEILKLALTLILSPGCCCNLTVATRVRNKPTGRGNRDFIILESSGKAGLSADYCPSVDDFSWGTSET